MISNDQRYVLQILDTARDVKVDVDSYAPYVSDPFHVVFTAAYTAPGLYVVVDSLMWLAGSVQTVTVSLDGVSDLTAGVFDLWLESTTCPNATLPALALGAEITGDPITLTYTVLELTCGDVKLHAVEYIYG